MANQQNQKGPIREMLSNYLGKVTGSTYRHAKRESKASEMHHAVEEIAELSAREQQKEDIFRNLYDSGKISTRQYGKLLKNSVKEFMHQLSGLEKAVKQYAPVIAVALLATAFGVYSFLNPSVTGNFMLNKKFDANFLMFGLILGAFAILLVAKLSARMIKR